jgi:hypothetical protein
MVVQIAALCSTWLTCLDKTKVLGAMRHNIAEGFNGSARQEASKRRAMAFTGHKEPGTFSWWRVESLVPFFWFVNFKVTSSAASSSANGASAGSQTKRLSGNFFQNEVSRHQNWMVRLARLCSGHVISPTRSKK